MRFNSRTLIGINRRFLTVLAAGVCLLGGALSGNAFATDLPPGLTSWLQKLDPNVNIRFDGLITFSNGESYLPVFPQDPAAEPNPVDAIRKVPENAKFPDLIQFNNNLFLLRMVRTASGKSTLPRMSDYPIELKEGLLPQDLVLPANLFIPAELKIILGTLPYNPQSKAHSDDEDPSSPGQHSHASQLSARGELMDHTLYVADHSLQRLVALDLQSGREQGQLDLNCTPSALQALDQGNQLFVTCLSSDQLLVVDTQAMLIKTRIPVGSKPGAMAVVKRSGSPERLFVSNRFSSRLTQINLQTLTPGPDIELPGSGGVMSYAPKTGMLYVADASAGHVYLVDMETLKVRRVLQTLSGISDLWVDEAPPERQITGDAALQASSYGAAGPQLWVASRSEHKVQLIDLSSGKVLRVFDVGKKPMAFAFSGENLYVVSANQDRLDVIDLKRLTVLSPLPLEAGSFPSGISLSGDGRHAFISSAALQKVYSVDLKAALVDRTFVTSVRGVALTSAAPPSVVEEENAQISTPLTPMSKPIDTGLDRVSPQYDNNLKSDVQPMAQRRGFFDKFKKLRETPESSASPLPHQTLPTSQLAK